MHVLKKFGRRARDLESGDLDHFVACAREGSMSDAARRLGVQPSVISKSVHRLEQQLGATLVRRTTRQMALTEIGLGFYERALVILDQIREAEMAARPESALQGRVKISAPSNIGRLCIGSHLTEFRARYPRIDLEIEIDDWNRENPAHTGLDLIFLIGDLPDAGLPMRKLADWPRNFLASSCYLEKHGSPSCLGDLGNHNLLMERGAGWTVEGPEGAHTLSPRSLFSTNSANLLHAALLSGLGIALASPLELKEELRAGHVRRVLSHYEGSSSRGLFALLPQPSLRSVAGVALDYFAMVCGKEFGAPRPAMEIRADQESLVLA